MDWFYSLTVPEFGLLLLCVYIVLFFIGIPLGMWLIKDEEIK